MRQSNEKTAAFSVSATHIFRRDLAGSVAPASAVGLSQICRRAGAHTGLALSSDGVGPVSFRRGSAGSSGASIVLEDVRTVPPAAVAALDQCRVSVRDPLPPYPASRPRSLHLSAAPAGACPNRVPFNVVVVDRVTGEFMRGEEPALMDCGTWHCPHCGPIKRRRYVAHFANLFAGEDSVCVLTLTLDPKLGIEAADSRAYLIYSWGKFRRRINRALRAAGRDPLKFVASVEYQKNGFAHMHVICNIGLPDEELGRHWFASGGGAVVYIDRLRCDGVDVTGRVTARADGVARMIGYVLKYALKEATENRARGRRYVLCSHGDGWYSESAKSDRKQLVEKSRGAVTSSEESVMVEQWEPLVTSKKRSGNPDALTPERLRKFAGVDGRRRSRRFVRRNASGRWEEWRYDARGNVTIRNATGPVHQTKEVTQ